MTRGPALEPARIVFDADGTARSADCNDIYHSATGALGQARQVFVAGNGLPQAWAARKHYAIFETGFGLGLNFLATWQAWRDDPRRPDRLHYFSVEKHPPETADLARAHRPYAEIESLSALLVGQWPERLAGFHRLHFEGGRVGLTLLFGDARRMVGQVLGRFDAFYLDGFSPERNPELWSAALMEDLAWLAAPGASCATYTIARPVRDALAGAGFAVEKRPGYGSKRDMLAGRYAGPMRAEAAPAAADGPIAVVGAGIAGAAVAERLAARGREVMLFEAQPRPAMGATGNHVAIMMPVLALEETRLARLNRAAFLYALRRLDELGRAGHAPSWSPCGVLHMPRSAELAERQARLIAEQALPAAFAALIDDASAREYAGAATASGGWWFPRAGWVSPVSLCAALLAAGGERVGLRSGSALARLEPAGEGWALYDNGNRRIADAATVVLAQSHGMLALPQASHLPLRCFRGQVSHLPGKPAEPPRCVVCGDGYVAPPVDGVRCLGATFQRSRDAALAVADHAANLAKLETMLPGLGAGIDAAALPGRAGLRPVSPDKLPMLGALPQAHALPAPPTHPEWPRHPGLHVATGYGARGLVWAHLMAELLASQLCGEPLPVEADLAAAVDPARFIWKGLT